MVMRSQGEDMVEWYQTLGVLEQVLFWLGIVSTVFLVVQLLMMSFSAFGGDIDIDGDGDIDVDMDTGLSLFTVKSITAFFAVGSWAGLLTSVLVPDGFEWAAVIVAVVAGLVALFAVAFILRAMLKLQCNGAVDNLRLVGKHATVYVSVPPARTGRGKITLEAQGRFMELDALTEEGQRIGVDEPVIIVSAENECMVVKRLKQGEESQNNAGDVPQGE